MSESMVERVARAMLTERGIVMTRLPKDALWLAYPKDLAFREAREVIVAMREPTEGMLEHPYYVNGEWSRRNIEAFVDAALAEP